MIYPETPDVKAAREHADKKIDALYLQMTDSQASLIQRYEKLAARVLRLEARDSRDQ